MAVFCNPDHLTSGGCGETWREWSSLELQVEKAESAREDHRRDFLSKCWVCALLAFSRDGSISCIMHGQNC